MSYKILPGANMSSEVYLFTSPGYRRLTEELKDLKANKRNEIINSIAEARSHGDLSENAEYSAAKEMQNVIENRISYLEKRLGNSQIVDISSMSGTKIYFGATVVLEDLDSKKETKYQLVGEDESDIKGGFLSNKSLLAKALLQKEEGDEFTLSTPAGEREYYIKSVKYVS